jgi:hypothetical protein
MISSPSPLVFKSHCNSVVEAITQGKVVFFFGDEINLCGRTRDDKGEVESWCVDSDPLRELNYPPTNIELALYLDKISGHIYSEVVRCPLTEKNIRDLPRGCPLKTDSIKKMALQQVSQYIDLLSGKDILPGTLGPIFEAEYPSNLLHQFLAGLPKRLKDKGCSYPYQLLVTTCFDNTLERAFKEAGQPFDLVSYRGRENSGRFVHQKFRLAGTGQIIEQGKSVVIEKPNEYQDEGLSLEVCPIILKFYGAIGDNLIVTEDHYIDYLAHRDLRNLMPLQLSNILDQKHILFLGYSPSYWNLRVILHRIWEDEIFTRAKESWWAIQSNSERFDWEFWVKYTGQEPIWKPLEDYIAELSERVQKKPYKIVPNGTSSTSDEPSPPIKRDRIFISYSHDDTMWLNRLLDIMTPAIDAGKIPKPWTDEEIKPGEEWRKKIEEALKSAKVAVLLVSENFLASDFIKKEELPPLLKDAEREGAKIIWVYLNYCGYKYTALKDLQAAHKISQPLSSLTKPKQDKTLTEICDEIVAAMPG